MILVGDVIAQLATLPRDHVDCVVTSPPYWGLRDYGIEGQIGLEISPTHYIAHMRMVFDQVKRVLKPNGTMWLNVGDTYATTGGAGHQGLHGDRHKRNHTQRKLLTTNVDVKAKELVGMPWRLAFALRADGWYLRQDIIWHKPNPMPESVRDRCTKAHEYIFLMTKQAKYYFDVDAIREPCLWPNGPNSPQSIKSPYGQGFTREAAKQARDKIRSEGLERDMRTYAKWNNPKGKNKRSVWKVSTGGFKGAHFATFPPALIEPCILAGCPEWGTVLDPFFGAGTVGVVAKKKNRNWIGIELNPQYAEIARARVGC